MQDLRIPVLLEQGENDSLFDLQEAVATYTALRKQHVPVKMVWQSWGHSSLDSPAGEKRSSTRSTTAGSATTSSTPDRSRR